MRQLVAGGVRAASVATGVVLLVAVGAGAADAGKSPKPALTPGAVNTKVTVAALCSRTATVKARPLSDGTKRRVFGAYHVARNARGGSTIDHLVPVELGGTNALANLWPVTKREARAKRVVVAKVVARVCAGEVDLATAQAAFVTGWRTALATATTTTSTTSTTSTTTTVAPPATVEVPETVPETAPTTVVEDIPQHSPLVPPPTVTLPDDGPIGPTTPPQPVQHPVHPS
jgi:hypothetical protein